MSEFIENSKHKAGTAAVESHFSGGNQGRKPGTDPLLHAPPYGDTAWNPTPGGIETGQVNQASPAAPGPSMFNGSSPPLPRETGVNYKPLKNAGHTVSDKAFEGWADGMPGDQRKLWRK